MEGEHQIPPVKARPGDWIEADTPGGGPAHRGMIVEVLGRNEHKHYRVRWDEQHESIFYPADGARVIRMLRARSRH